MAVVFGSTRILTQDQNENTGLADPKIKPLDMGMPRPWRIALWIMHIQLQLVFDLSSDITIGRAHPESNTFPDIDLTPFDAEELGVSRKHLQLKLDNDRVVVVDLRSANGTRLNGEKLEPLQTYPIRHKDKLLLGMMLLQVELLTSPFS